MNRLLGRALLYIFLLFLPFQFALNIQEGFDVGIIRPFIIFLFFIWMFVVLLWEKPRFPRSMIFYVACTFLFFALFSILWAENQEWALRKGIFLVNFFLLFVMASWMFTKQYWSLELLSQGLALSGFVSAVIGIFQWILPFFFGIEKVVLWWRLYITPFFLGGSFSEVVVEYSSWLVNVVEETLFRAIAFFPDPHVAAFYWEICLVWTAIYAYKSKSSGYFFMTGVIFLALLLTFSRGAYVAIFLLMMGSVVFFMASFRSIRIVFIISALSLILFSLVFHNNPFFERALSSFSLLDTSNTGRLEMWERSLESILEKPWGLGLGGYALEVVPSSDYRDPIYAHNLYLDIAVEMGVFTLFLWMVWIGISFGEGIRYAKKTLYGLAIAFSLALFSLHAFFDTPLFSIHVISILFLVLGSVFGLEKKYVV